MRELAGLVRRVQQRGRSGQVGRDRLAHALNPDLKQLIGESDIDEGEMQLRAAQDKLWTAVTTSGSLGIPPGDFSEYLGGTTPKKGGRRGKR